MVNVPDWGNKRFLPVFSQIEGYTHWVEGNQKSLQYFSCSFICSHPHSQVTIHSYNLDFCLFGPPSSPSPLAEHKQVNLHTLNIPLIWFHCGTQGRHHQSITTRFSFHSAQTGPHSSSQHSTPGSHYRLTSADSLTFHIIFLNHLDSFAVFELHFCIWFFKSKH